MLFFITGLSGAEQVEPVLNTEINKGTIFENPWFVISLCLGVILLLFYFFKKFTALRIENFESYTSHQEQVVKIRTLSILSLVLFPLTEYYESIYLQLYPTDWVPVLVIVLVSIISLAFSFKRNISFAFLNLLPQVSYYTVYALIAYKSIKANMLPIMAVETACLVLFSKLIFTKLKTLLYFLVFVTVANIVLLNIFNIPEYNLDIYLSALIQASIVSISLFLIEGSSNRKVAFGNKILESSNLFVLVADSKANFVYVNQSLETVTGLKQNEILHDGWWKYLGYNEETTEGLKKLIKESISKNQFSTYESTIVDAKGDTIYVSWDNSIIEEKYLLAVGKNVTLAKLLQIEEDKRKEKVNKYSKTLNTLTRFQHNEKSDADNILKYVTSNVAEALDIGRVSIWNYYDSRIVCQNLYSKTFDEHESGAILSDKDYPTYFKAISEARIIDAPDALNHPDTIEFSDTYFKMNKVRSLLDIPIFINGELKAVLCCESIGINRVWDAEDINFAKAVADFVALSIEAVKRKDLEREYRFILNNVGDIIYTTDALGNFDFINKTAGGLLGYSINELKGRHFTSIIHPDYKERTALFYLRQFKQRKESTYLEFKIINAEGKDYWVGQTVKLVTDRNDPEKIRGFQAVVRDINKQKETELALTESENNFRQINESISDVFFLYNFGTQKYDYISPNCEKILGAKQDFFYEGQSYTQTYVHESDRDRLIELHSGGKSKEEYTTEYRVIINGNIKWLEERAFPVKNERGVTIKSCGICTDITESKYQKEQLKQLSLVAKTVSNGVVITNRAGLIEWCNESYLTMMEYNQEELIGKRPIEIFSGPETKSDIVQLISETKLEGNNIEILNYTKSGKPIWLMITNTPVLDASGNLEKYVEIVTDITERKKLEGDYRYIIDNAGDVIYTANTQGVVEFLNESVTKILGYKPEELIGKHFTYIIHPDDKRMVNLFYLKQYKQLKEDSYFEFRVVNKHGEVNWVGQNVKLIIDNSNNNKVKGFQSILRDITRQKETEIALIESENNFRQINETIHDVFYLYNVIENKYDYVSPNAINILGVDNIYFYYVNNYITDYIVPKDREMVREAYKKINQGEPFEIEYRITVDQEITWIKEKSSVIRDSNGVVIKTSGTCSDVTQRKMQEKRLLKINQELSLYSEDLEINNLLKEQLIYTNSFEEIAKVSLNTLKVKITNIKRGSLMLVNQNNNVFDTYYVEDDEIKRGVVNFADTKAYPSLLKAKRFIEHNLDLSSNLSKSDIQWRKENVISYIVLPISYSNTLIGALMLSFETPFSVSKRDIDMLESFTSVLSVVVNKLGLQKELSEKSKDILASLNYARGIQQSILPNMNLHKESVHNFMRFYLPKDVVSGDFYVIESFDEYTLLALGDCTGHGVPGAFLTLLGSNFLQRIAVENKVTSPLQILELLDYQLFTMLNKNREETIRDGMELGLCIYNNKTKKLTFAGAGLFLVYYKDNEQYIVQGSKRSIGDENHSKVDFEETTIEITGNEKFFLFSDGYRDQLGGVDKRKRYSRAKFLDLLNKIKNLPPFQQEYILKMEHNKHRGKYEQTDDISVIGFELK